MKINIKLETNDGGIFEFRENFFLLNKNLKEKLDGVLDWSDESDDFAWGKISDYGSEDFMICILNNLKILFQKYPETIEQFISQ